MPKIQTPDGDLDAVDTDFDVHHENVSVYETKDPAVRVRIRTVVTRILVARNDDGTVKTNKNGEPIVLVQSQNLVTAEIRD